MTPHIESKLEDIASTVIMPGDPKRATYIANKFLTDAKLVNEVRGELAYTGYYKGKKVTVFSSGMGNPSMGIYSHELFDKYNVENIIRVGSAGSYVADLNVKDLFLVETSYSKSYYMKEVLNLDDDEIKSSEYLNKIIKETAKELDLKIKPGKAYSSDVFYSDMDYKEFIEKTNCECVEMETFSLYTNAKKLNKNASCILSISDSFVTKQELSSEERTTGFDNMITLVLESILKI